MAAQLTERILDWDRAIERNTLALLRIVGALFALLVSARVPGSGLNVPRHVWRSILHVLRPAEAAVRRLVIIAARTLASVSHTLRLRSANGSSASVQRRLNTFSTAPAFRLFDPLKPVHGIFEEEDDEALAVGESRSFDDTDALPVNAIHLHNRLRALRHALADLPKQAARLARFNARRDALLKAGRPVRISLMRPGLPPGWRERGRHDVDTVLKECHRLVRYLEDSS